MPITLRNLKQSPLTIEELDGNFEDLDQRIRHFENNTETLESIQSVDFKEGKLIITSNKGNLLGEILFPAPKLQFKGEWQAQKPYYANDLIIHEGKLLLCIKPHSQEFYSFENWTIVFEIPRPPELFQSLPLVEKTHLPSPELGKLVMLIDKTPTLLVGDGQAWHEILLKKFE